MLKQAAENTILFAKKKKKNPKKATNQDVKEFSLPQRIIN